MRDPLLLRRKGAQIYNSGVVLVTIQYAIMNGSGDSKRMNFWDSLSPPPFSEHLCCNFFRKTSEQKHI